MVQYPEQRHRIERRVQGERRRWLDRRVAQRRLERLRVAEERRVSDRRARERRAPIPRRKRGDRRGSGLSFSDSTPLTVI